jgi:alpha-1,3-rhamnosyl/mannosyltransferase
MSKYDLESDKYFLFVSMLYHYKKPDIAIRAFAMNGEEFKSMGIKLVIVGGVADRAFSLTLENLIDELNMRGSVILAGYVPKEDLPNLYANCRAFLLPTVIETFGQPFVEAMAAGSCVIAADLPFAREICADAALYFEKDNIIMLSDLMLEVSGSNVLVNDCREHAANRIKFFSWKKEAIETISLLRESVF